MNKHIAIVVDWYGPYSLNEAIKVSRKDFGEGLYLLIGKTKYQKKPSKMQYIGIADDLFSRINGNHQKIPELSQECSIWLGEIASLGIPGPKSKVTNVQLDLAEWLHSYFLELPLNERKKVNPPDNTATLLNRWWFKDYETPRQKRPHKDWPDLIEYTGKKYGAKAVWFGVKLIKWRPEEI